MNMKRGGIPIVSHISAVRSKSSKTGHIPSSCWDEIDVDVWNYKNSSISKILLNDSLHLLLELLQGKSHENMQMFLILKI